jgi:hypothetical protein
VTAFHGLVCILRADLLLTNVGNPETVLQAAWVVRTDQNL